MTHHVFYLVDVQSRLSTLLLESLVFLEWLELLESLKL